MFLNVHCTTSIYRHVSYRKHENVTSFPLPSSNLLSSPGIKPYLPSLTSKFDLSPRPSFPPGTLSPLNFQHVFLSIKILFCMTLFNAILLDKPRQFILVCDILTNITLFFLAYLKFSFNMSDITCCIDMDIFSTTSKAFILVAIYIFLCLQNKTFVDMVQTHFVSDNCCGKSTKYLAVLPRFFFSITNLTYFSGSVLLSTVISSVKFILSLFLSIFKYRIFMFLLFLTYLYPLLYKNNSSVSSNFLPEHFI